MVWYSLQEIAWVCHCLTTFGSLSTFSDLLIETSCHVSEVCAEDVVPRHVTQAIHGDHCWRKIDWLGTVIDSFAVDVRNVIIICPVKHNHRWLFIKSSNVACLVTSCFNITAWRLRVNRVAVGLFFELSGDGDDTVSVRVVSWITTITFVLSFFSVR